jgi:signal transduction histidine kinase
MLLVIFRAKTHSDRKKNIFINRLRLIEQENVRRQTAEDFHDDLGNKLTRINMLSELLDKKIPPDLADEKKIIHQIRSSVSEIYSGTKNIIWALNPANDGLGEIFSELRLLGDSLFDHTATSFTALPYPEELNKIKFPLGYSHNIILIFKELLNNILKHARATAVIFSITGLSDNQICFTIADDGTGFQTDQEFTGNGLRNVQNRAIKLKGKITLESGRGKGSIATLTISFA